MLDTYISTSFTWVCSIVRIHWGIQIICSWRLHGDLRSFVVCCAWSLCWSLSSSFVSRPSASSATQRCCREVDGIKNIRPPARKDFVAMVITMSADGQIWRIDMHGRREEFLLQGVLVSRCRSRSYLDDLSLSP